MAALLLTDPAVRERYTNLIPVGRMGTVDEIGGICVFLASPAASYINGATIWADGGGGFGQA
jgi:NAD(P)-dependent dehydrogenase (short-subunit alcohol dehydrogenase family)